MALPGVASTHTTMIQRMNKTLRIVVACLLAVVALQANAQDKKDMFNPVNTSVTSQTIAPEIGRAHV